MNWGQEPVRLVTKVASGMSKWRTGQQTQLCERERLATMSDPFGHWPGEVRWRGNG